MNEIHFRSMTDGDVKEVRELLEEAQLPAEDLATSKPDMILAAGNGALLGCVGIEVFDEGYGLLRSLAVRKDVRRRGLGAALYERAVLRATDMRLERLFLLTTTAETFFARRGFHRIERSTVPSIVAASSQFSSLCPLSAVCMTLAVESTPRYYPGDTLPLCIDVPGARRWAVALDKVMLTYFEVEPTCRFERHQHESEQVTLVLEGELTFDIGAGRRITVKPGEVIALPTHVAYEVTAGAVGVRAVDAWSPIRPDYLSRVGHRTCDRGPGNHAAGEVRSKRPSSGSIPTVMPFSIRPTTPRDVEWVKQRTITDWGGAFLIVHDETIWPERLPGFLAEQHGTPIGLVTYHIRGSCCYVITLVSMMPRGGVGSALMRSVEDAAGAAGCDCMRLTTTNDNVHAVGFYQRIGYRITAVHRDAVDRARGSNPSIPMVGQLGIPLHDELEFEKALPPR